MTNPVSNIPAPSGTSLGILHALQRKHIYAGTVPANVKAKRRAASKVARVSRRRNR